MGLQLRILNATTIGDIDAAFATFADERPDALFISGGAFFIDRRVQFATLRRATGFRRLMRSVILLGRRTDELRNRPRGHVSSGRRLYWPILKGAKPADLPVLQSTKFEFVLNLQTARALGIEVPPGVLSIADEVIE